MLPRKEKLGVKPEDKWILFVDVYSVHRCAEVIEWIHEQYDKLWIDTTGKEGLQKRNTPVRAHAQSQTCKSCLRTCALDVSATCF